MKFSEYSSQASLDAIPGWEERLRRRQEELSGARNPSCLITLPASAWPRKIRRNKLVVAAMCCAENECAACLEVLRRA